MRVFLFRWCRSQAVFIGIIYLPHPPDNLQNTANSSADKTPTRKKHFPTQKDIKVKVTNVTFTASYTDTCLWISFCKFFLNFENVKVMNKMKKIYLGQGQGQGQDQGQDRNIK
jgi:hypothetical protein